MKNFIKYLSIVLVSFSITGCMNFGEDIELSGSAIDKKIFSKIAMLTDVSIPVEAKGLNYLYLGAGIDDSLKSRINISNEIPLIRFPCGLYRSIRYEPSACFVTEVTPWACDPRILGFSGSFELPATITHEDFCFAHISSASRLLFLGS